MTNEHYFKRYMDGRRDRLDRGSVRKRDFGWILILLLIIDAFGFIAWHILDQVPADTWYIGMITNWILNGFK